MLDAFSSQCRAFSAAVDLLGTLFLSMLSVLILPLRPFDRTSDARRVHTQMPGDLRGREAKLFPAPAGNPRPRCAHLPPLASPLNLRDAYLLLLTFFFDDLVDGFSGASVLELPYLAVVCFPENALDKVAAAQDALVRFFFLPSPSHGDDLGPSPMASDESATGKLRDMPLLEPLSHEPPICIAGLA